jgi:hypothetical protein
MTEETPQTTNRVPSKERLHPESWLLWTIIAALLPLAGMTLLLIWTGPYSLALRWTLTTLLVAASGWFSSLSTTASSLSYAALPTCSFLCAKRIIPCG